ncbi:MAG: SsrA-binding protein SmpB [Candidatus Sericytochromatia bacterium]|nr:SsrA-binding protein SmpB [Candidatus Sericytochromatia bacterium]
MGEDGGKLIAENRKAYHEYHILERIEAGIELTGTEIKSLRMGQVSLREAFARIDDGELWLHNCHIAPYTHGNRFNHEPLRKRRLLLHKREIMRLFGKTRDKGSALVPTKLYWKGDWAKIEIALGSGKKLHDKRETIVGRDHQREMERALKQSVR